MMRKDEIYEKLLPTPWVGSYFGRGREGNKYAKDPVQRAQAWAHWALSSFGRMSGYSDREYYAIMLPGEFYDPKGTGPSVKPHIEIPTKKLLEPDPFFPDRLAQMGNGLTFPWWVVSEVTAVKRSLFTVEPGDISEVIKTLNERQALLAQAVKALNTQLENNWGKIQNLLVSEPDGLAEESAGSFSVEDIIDFFPASAPLRLRITFDQRLKEKNGKWVSRRLGVWQVKGMDYKGDMFSFGVITPRLTANSLFKDAHFSPEKEAPASLLVRGLLLKRLLNAHFPIESKTVIGNPIPKREKNGPALRSVVAKVGAKLPEAGVKPAVLFLQTYQDSDDAWKVLNQWKTKTESQLTVLPEAYKTAHANALKMIKRAEEPTREDINTLLPLAWDKKGRVVRVTFARHQKTK